MANLLVLETGCSATPTLAHRMKMAVEMLVDRTMAMLVLAHPASDVMTISEITRTAMDAIMFALHCLAETMNVAVAAHDQTDLAPLPVEDLATKIVP
jgi:hypothetical protein